MRVYFLGLIILFSVVTKAQSTEVQTNLAASHIYILKDINSAIVEMPVLTLSADLGFGTMVPFAIPYGMEFNGPAWICKKLGFDSLADYKGYQKDAGNNNGYVAAVSYTAGADVNTMTVSFIESRIYITRVNCKIHP